MKASVERLRWGLAGAGVLLLVVLAGFLGYGSLRKGRLWKKEIQRLGAALHSPHETDNFTYSNSLQGKTSYTVHAAKVIQHGDGTWTLNNVAITLFSKSSPAEDHVYSADIEYDEHTGVATAVGDVTMDLQAPGTLANAKIAQGGVDGDRVIHVKTSGLVYVRRLAVAATDQMVSFQYAGMNCTAKGAEFDSGESFLHLLADVQLTGMMRRAPMTVHAEKADLDRTSNTVAMVGPVAVSQGQTARAANALLYLRKDGSLDHADANGGVSLDAGTRHVTAASFSGTFNAISQPQSTKLMGGVAVNDSSSARPMHAVANEVDATFNAVGLPVSVVGIGGAGVSMVQRAAGQPDLTREMHGERIAASFVQVPVEGGKAAKTMSRVSEVVSTGGAMAKGTSLAAAKDGGGVKTSQVNADTLRAEFEAKAAGSELQKVFGDGCTRLEQDAPNGARQTSVGDRLQVEFAEANGNGAGAKMEVVSAVQTGGVKIHSVPARPVGGAKVSPVSDASADKATYAAEGSKLTLNGAAHFVQAGTELSAATIVVDQKTGDAAAEGTVLASMQGGAADGTAAAKDSPMTHVTGDRAQLTHASQLAQFWGTDAKPARLWQEASQVQAASLLFDQKQRTLTARPAAAGGVVHAVFAGEAQPDAKKPGGKGEDHVVRVVSAAMDYDDVNREATFGGGVRIDGEAGHAQSQRGTVFLNAAQAPAAGKATGKAAAPGFGGSVRRIVLSDDVKVEEPGRSGTGEQLVYTAADASFILTGTAAKPPHMVDAVQGSITGGTLLFHQGQTKGDSTIVVAGSAGDASQAKHGRVRTETEVKK